MTSRAGGLWGTRQLGWTHEICLPNMLSLVTQTVLTISCYHKDYSSPVWTNISPNGKQEMLQESSIVRELRERTWPTYVLRSSAMGRLGGWHCWNFQKVLESIVQWLVLTGEHVWTQKQCRMLEPESNRGWSQSTRWRWESVRKLEMLCVRSRGGRVPPSSSFCIVPVSFDFVLSAHRA